MKGTVVWASRDSSKPKNIKLWGKEPEYIQPNGAYSGKDYLGIACAEKWPGPTIGAGSHKRVLALFIDFEE